MPPRVVRPSAANIATNNANQHRITAPFHPPADTATFKDLLLFEERLKMNTQMLRKRKRRYEAFLVCLVASIIFLAHRTVLRPPSYPIVRYLTQGLLAVALVTLILFFASGMYQERIRYANRYVPHANRSLRTINMHLNMRRAPRSYFSFLPFLKTPTPSSTSNTKPTPSSLKAKNGPVTPQVMSPIPPTLNPRGELIFSSRVDRTFREGYERYRAAFEKRREDKLREQNAGKGVIAWLAGRKTRAGSPGLSGTGTGTGRTGTTRRSETPPMSRMSTPPLLDPSSRDRSRSSSPAGTGLARQAAARTAQLRDGTFEGNKSTSSSNSGGGESNGNGSHSRSRAESYSFILTNAALTPGGGVSTATAVNGQGDKRERDSVDINNNTNDGIASLRNRGLMKISEDTNETLMT